MGNFAGHFIPGLFFFIYGFAWIFLWFRHYIYNQKGSRSYQHKESSSSNGRLTADHYTLYYGHNGSPCSPHIPWPSRGFCSKVPLEPLMKILLCSLGIICEAFFAPIPGKLLNPRVMTVFNADGSLGAVSKLHHITMYSVFALSGAVDLLVVAVPAIPRNVSKVFLTLAFFIEGLLLWFHSHGSEMIEVTVHSLLFLTISISVILSLLRLPKPDNFIVNILLGLSIMIQGTWFIHIGAILYGGSTTWQDHHSKANETKQLMLAVVLFSWHVIVCMLFAGILFIAMHTIIKYCVWLQHCTNTAAAQRCNNSRVVCSWQTIEDINDDSLEMSNDTTHHIIEETKLINHDNMP